MSCGEPAWWEDLYSPKDPVGTEYMFGNGPHNSDDVTIDNMEEFDNYFNKQLAVPFEAKHMADQQYVDGVVEGSLLADDEGKLLQYDGNDWGIIKEFDLFTVEMVRKPLSIGCEIRLSDEDRYDKAMEGI